MPAAYAVVPLDTWPATVTQVDCEAHLMQTRWESLPGPGREGLRSGLSGSAMNCMKRLQDRTLKDELPNLKRSGSNS